MNDIFSLLSKHRSAMMGFAILWIMVFHLPSHHEIHVLSQLIYWGYGGVDIFLFLSGFGLYFSLSKKDISLSKYYKKRFSRILPEFWLYLIILYISTMDFSQRSLFTLIYKATTIGFWIPGTPFELWYISCILLFYAIFPFYYKSFNKSGISTAIKAIAIGGIMILIYAMIMVLCFNNENKGGGLILAISRIPIFFIGSIFGYYAKKKANIIINYTRIIFLSIIFCISLLPLYFSYKYCSAYLWTCALHWIPFIIITPILCIMLAFLFEKCHFLESIFNKIGMISLELYIMHTFVYFQTDIKNIAGGEYSTPILLLTSFIFAYILYYINIKFLQKLI